MARETSESFVPAPAEITDEQAAGLLNVSQFYLAGLLDEGIISSRRVGALRLVRLSDLLNFKRADDKARGEILDHLTAEAQDLGIGY